MASSRQLRPSSHGENSKKEMLRSQRPGPKGKEGQQHGRKCLSHIVLTRQPRSGRTTQLEENPCISPFFQAWVTGNQQSDTSQQLPDADDAQEAERIAKMRHYVSNRWPSDQD